MVFLSVLLYGTQHRPAPEKNFEQITTSVRFLRRIVEKSQKDRVRNEVIMRELGVYPIREKIEECHVYMMPEVRRVKWYMEANPNGRRPGGRLRTMYRK